MKILRISLRNLASLAGTQTVDFTRGDLARHNLFAISGPTGAGKSTLLDALCLALYEETPRLSAVKGAVKLADKGDDAITQKDAANLLRRGTGEGFAEVAFIGVDGETYTGRWLVRRARNNPDGALQNTDMALFRGDVAYPENGVRVGGDKKRGVKEAIVEKIGLTYDQFTRAVLLAQNDFATFLKADDAERAGILQALTGTTRFEKISRAAFERNKRMEAAVLEIDNKLKGLDLLDEPARAALDASLDAHERDLAALVAQKTVREEQARWHRDARKLADALRDAEARLADAKEKHAAAAARRSALARTEDARKHLGALAADEARATRARHECESERARITHDADKARTALAAATTYHTAAQQALDAVLAEHVRLKPDLDTARALDAQLTPLDAARATAAADARRAADEEFAADDARQRAETAVLEAREAVRKLIARRDKISVYEPLLAEASGWSEKLAVAARARDEAEAKEAERRDAAAKLTVAEKAAAAARTEAETADEARRRALNEFETSAARIAGLDDPEAPARRQALTGRLESVRTLANLLRERDAAAAAIAEEAALHGKREAKIAADTDRAREFDERHLPAATLAFEKADAAFLATAAVVDGATAHLRAELKPGLPCAVCGATDHPYLQDRALVDAMAAQVGALKKARELAKKELEKLTREKTGLDARIIGETNAAADARRRLDADRQKLADLTARIDARRDADTAPILALAPEAQAEACDAAGHALEAGLRTLTERETTLRRLRADHAKLQAVADAAREHHERLDKRLGAAAADVRLATERRDLAVASAEKAARDAARARDDVAPVFAVHEKLEAAFDRDAGKFLENFRAVIVELRALQDKLREADDTVAKRLLAQEQTAKELAAARLRATEAREKSRLADKEHAAVAARRRTLLAGRSVEDFEAIREEQDRNARERLRLALEAENTARLTLKETETRLLAAQDALTKAEAARAAAVIVLDDALATFAARHGVAFDRETLAAALARDEASLLREYEALRALDDAVTENTGRLASRRTAHETHLAARPTPEEAEVVEAALAELEAARQAKNEERDLARARQFADDRARGLAGDLAAKSLAAKKAAEPWGKLNELIGSADGSKFRDIAQRHTLDLLLGYANAQLSLFAGRYRMERVPRSLNLQVVDTHMGDERRSVHSLSGGESFLVSLALALGLASLTSNRLRIESLFIDEGFGALDQETLTTALNALMHLEAQGRKIGVISHVSEMADAIPVQIRVRRRHGASYLHCPGTPDLPPEDLAPPADKKPASSRASRKA